MTYLILFLVIPILVGTLYFISNPILMDLHQILRPHSLKTLEDARNYYTVISSVATTILGFLGIILGYIYFTKRIAIDKEFKKRQEQHRHLELLLNEIDNHDKTVYKILLNAIKDEKELHCTRGEIGRFFDNMTPILEDGKRICGLTEVAIEKTIEMHAYVDKSFILTRAGYSELNAATLEIAKESYCEKLSGAKNEIYKCF